MQIDKLPGKGDNRNKGNKLNINKNKMKDSLSWSES